MTALITLLISLLGYGTPADYENYTEAELNQAIEQAEAQQEEQDGGGWNDWDNG